MLNLPDVVGDLQSRFPSRYIHIGGDEVPKDRWRLCASFQALMKREHIVTEEPLHTWFVGQIDAYLALRGRRRARCDRAVVASARYLRVLGRNAGVLPAGHPGAGKLVVVR